MFEVFILYILKTDLIRLFCYAIGVIIEPSRLVSLADHFLRIVPNFSVLPVNCGIPQDERSDSTHSFLDLVLGTRNSQYALIATAMLKMQYTHMSPKSRQRLEKLTLMVFRTVFVSATAQY